MQVEQQQRLSLKSSEWSVHEDEDFIERIQARAGEIKDETKPAREILNQLTLAQVKLLICWVLDIVVEGVHIILDRMKVLGKSL